MEHYVTLFDSLFLPQGLALQMSMDRHAGDYTLWVLCVDDEAHRILQEINLPRVRLLRLPEVETDELKRVRPGRTRGEYCWTLTPFAVRFVFEADPEATRVTYLDADLWFRQPPSRILREFDASGRKVLITDHAYAPEYDQSATSGQYCVQFMTFLRHEGEVVRKWWEERCIEWCFARIEDGKFGDQKYLDDWPERFRDEVHVLADEGLALAPWNAIRFPYGRSVFFHFHSLRIVADDQVELGPYSLPLPVIDNIYRFYLLDLRKAVELLKSRGVVVRKQAAPPGLLRSLKSRTLSKLASLVKSGVIRGHSGMTTRY